MHLAGILNKQIQKYNIGIEYNGKIYFNVHPAGLPSQTWINDFDADNRTEGIVLRMSIWNTTK